MRTIHELSQWILRNFPAQTRHSHSQLFQLKVRKIKLELSSHSILPWKFTSLCQSLPAEFPIIDLLPSERGPIMNYNLIKFHVAFNLIRFIALGFQQQLNRQQNQIHSLAYSESDFNQLPVIPRTTTTTTEAPDTTTKKKGFFSGITGLFKSKDKEVETSTTTTTQRPTTTQKSVTTSTVKSTSVASIAQSTPKVPPRFDLPLAPPAPPPRPVSPPIPPPRQAPPAVPTSTAAPKKTTKDEFPPLPTQSNNRPNLPTVAPSAPSAWGKPPGADQGPTPKPQSFFPQQSTTSKKFLIATPPTSSTPVSSGPVTDAELLSLSESLFSKDIHNPFKFVTVNYQGRTQSSANSDEAPQP